MGKINVYVAHKKLCGKSKKVPTFFSKSKTEYSSLVTTVLRTWRSSILYDGWGQIYVSNDVDCYMMKSSQEKTWRVLCLKLEYWVGCVDYSLASITNQCKMF